MKSIITPILVLTFLYYSNQTFPIDDPMLQEWYEFSQKDEGKRLIRWLRRHAFSELTGRRCKKRINVKTPPYFGRLGIFITLKKGNRVRGCYGAFSHLSTSIETLLIDYLKGALTGDSRYDPLDISEFEDTDIIITITSAPNHASDINSVDLKRYGIVLTCDSGTRRVFVPAELRSTSYLSKYMKGKMCQISVFKAVTIR